MHSDSEPESSDTNGKVVKYKVQQICQQSRLNLNQLSTLKKQLKDINRSRHFESYVQQLNEIGKTVRNLSQNIRYIDELHSQVNEKDRGKLDNQISTLRKDIDYEMTEFQALRQQAKDMSIDGNVSSNDGNFDDNNLEEKDPILREELRQRHATKTTTADRLETSYKLLEEDLRQLRETVDEVAQLVAQHNEKVSRTEQIMNMAHDQIHSASVLLQNATQNRYTRIGAGALLGAVVGGPIGCLLSFKVGALAALSGSAVGALSANLWQRRETQNPELQNNDNTAYSQAML